MKWRIIPAVALVLAGIAAIATAVAANERASGKGKWVQTLATIERVDAQSVAYRYTSGGRAHTSNAPLLPADRYSPGRKALIYVNPADPAQSLLRLPARPPQWPMMAGTVAVVIGASLAFYFWRAATPRFASKPDRFSGTATGRRQVKNPGPPVRKAAPPLSRLRPPPQVVRKPTEEEMAEEETAGEETEKA